MNDIDEALREFINWNSAAHGQSTDPKAKAAFKAGFLAGQRQSSEASRAPLREIAQFPTKAAHKDLTLSTAIDRMRDIALTALRA